MNEQPGLASMHTIFVRLHNVFESRIRNRRPNFSNETLFQVRNDSAAAQRSKNCAVLYWSAYWPVSYDAPEH